MHWQRVIILASIAIAALARPSWSDPPATAEPLYSEAFCLKIFEGVIEQARSSTWQISDRDRHILTQCRAKFPATTNAQIPLPKAAECLELVKTLVQGGLSKVKELELPEERVRSIERCDEVIKYHALTVDNMVPTLKPTERLVIDKTAYQTQSPQRGDIIIFNPIPPLPTENSQAPSIQRTIGLPGEKVRIERGKIYINGKLLREDYLTSIAIDRSATIVVPANSYLLLDDNPRSSTRDRFSNIISRAEIIGKVIWHFSGKE
jgi:signal peptidase I